MTRCGYVYIMTNRVNGTLYTGMTSDLARRIGQHREGSGSDFCRDNRLTRLVFVEHHPLIVDAIAREKAVKSWKRAWRLNLIESVNPEWKDLWLTIHDWI